MDANGNIKAEGTITSNGLDAGTGEIKTTGKVSAGDVSTGTLETSGDATIGGTLNTKDVTAETIRVSKSEDTPDYKSEGKIIGEGGNLSVSNEKTYNSTNITEKSQLHVDEKGTVNWATSTDNATGNVTEGRSEVTADNIKNSVKKTEGGKTFGYEENITADGKVGTVTDKDGNTSSTRQDSKGIYGYAKDKDGNKSYTKQEGNRIAESVIGQDGKETKSEMTSTDITNTAKDGTITNDAKDIVNKASGNISNSSATMDTTVTGKATESYGELETEVKGNEKHTVKGDQINEVDGKQINTIKNGQENIISGGQINNITGDQTTTVTGDISNTAKNITNEATTKLTDKVGANTRVLDGEGITDTVGGSTFKQRINAIMGNVKTADGESEVTQKGDEINSVVGKGEATNSRVTQKKGSIEAAVTDGTNTNVSYDIANASAKKLTDGTRVNESVDNLDSSKKTITDGTHTTSKVQTALDIINTAADGTITNDAKNIVNNATGDMTNTVGGKLTTTVTGATEENYNGGLTTKVTGEEKHTVTGKQTNTVEGGQENIISGGQTNTITGGQINNITGDQTTTITGNKTETVTENVTEDYKKNLTTTVGGNEIHDVKGTKTETVEGKVTENFKGGQETNVTGNQDIHVTGKQTNKIDGDQENTIGGNQTTTVTGDISNKAENITNEANTKLTDKVGDHTRVLDSDGITDTVGGSTFKQRIDKIMMESKDVSIKAEETLTNEAKVITNKASEVINNEAVNINNTATGIITSKASEIKNQADKLISNKVGENTWENMENGKITTSIKDGAKQNLTQSDAAGTTQSTVDGGKSTVTIQNADGLTDAVTDGRNISVQNQTASQIAADVKDGAGNENASVATATTSANTIKNGTKANTVISTADGTSFINSEAAAPVTGASGAGTHLNTTIKGNTITTGKVTMDYAEVMKDLGVRGNANITGKTTTGSLEVKGESKLTGDVTMESNATVKKDLTVEGNTNLKNTKVDGTLDVTQKATFGDSVSIAKDLSVDGNATIKGDVTAKSYKVGDKTYISAAGINANDQKITNVADGSISEGSKDAVNGGQLYTVKNDLEGKVNKVGANAAAMANLHPMEFDPSSKWNIAAAIGNYGSETAAALGAFYRPNDDVMVNLSTAFGTGENMVGGGVSVRLGKGGNKLSREETNALKAQVADLTARMDALLSVLNPNMSKDFPDVPENHWAYEAVSRLAGNDIVQGYPDGEFHGERTMTRYEMAEIIYNALSRGAEAEKELVEEFKPELQAMAASEKATAEKAEG